MSSFPSSKIKEKERLKKIYIICSKVLNIGVQILILALRDFIK